MTLVSQDKRKEYWEYFTSYACRRYIPRVCTARRLAKIKEIVLANDMLWDEVVLNHNGLSRTPEQMRYHDEFTFNHCIGNFYGEVVGMIGIS